MIEANGKMTKPEESPPHHHIYIYMFPDRPLLTSCSRLQPGETCGIGRGCGLKPVEPRQICSHSPHDAHVPAFLQPMGWPGVTRKELA